MSIFREYESEEDKKFDILDREFTLAIHNANARYAYESAILSSVSSSDTFMEKTSFNGNEVIIDKKESPFKKVIQSIVNAVINLINGVQDMITSIFSGKEAIDVKAFSSSSTGQVQMDYDMKAIHEQVEAERRKGRKLIQLISKGTGISDKEVADFVDKGADFIDKHHRTIVKGAALAATVALVDKGLNSGKDNIQDCAKMAEGITDPKKQNQARNVLKALSDRERGFSHVANYVIKSLTKDNKRIAKQNK